MIRIITAIGNSNLNNELKKYEDFDIVGNDIIYSEGIFELLEKNTDVKYLILGENFSENINYCINKIKEINKKINIIFIINKKNKNLEDQLYKKGIQEIFYEDEEIENIINYLKTKNIEYLNLELRNEINDLKKILLEENNKKINKRANKKLIIGVCGTAGIGKTTACILFAKALSKNNRALIIDFNLLNSQLGFLYNKKIEYTQINESNLNNFIFKVEKNIDIFIGIDILYSYKKLDFICFKNYINKIKSNYDYIFFDTNIKIEPEKNKELFLLCDYIFLLTGINKIDLNKNEKIIDYFINKIKIDKEKIKILFYKLNCFEVLRYKIQKINNNMGINDVGFLKNSVFFKSEIKKSNFLINKLLIRKIIKKI